MLSPCILPGHKQQSSFLELCNDVPSCYLNKWKHALAAYDPMLHAERVIGIAKDGRFIYGPFKSDGTEWQPCDVDICNGRLIDDKYAYVSTLFYPYTVGCFGPGNYPSLTPSCTTNPRVCLP